MRLEHAEHVSQRLFVLAENPIAILAHDGQAMENDRLTAAQ
jgi:hypothetical protein